MGRMGKFPIMGSLYKLVSNVYLIGDMILYYTRRGEVEASGSLWKFKLELPRSRCVPPVNKESVRVFVKSEYREESLGPT